MYTDDQIQHHDIIAIGTSAGGQTALTQLVAQLPANLPAAVFIVLHRPAHASDEVAVWMLQKVSKLRCLVPKNGEEIQRGSIYLAPADDHMLLKEGKIVITRGPRENHYRPSIDTTFRSAAVSYGARVIGVVLTGMLQDGTAGMEAIKRSGGVCVVQQPADAEHASMPQSVLSNLQVDFSVDLQEMGVILQELVHRPADVTRSIPADLILEARIAERYMDGTEKIGTDIREMDELGDRTPVSCPDCGGGIWQVRHGSLARYRCHLGHAFTAATLLQQNKESLEAALWIALRTLEERKIMLATMADQTTDKGNSQVTGHYQDKVTELQGHIQLIRQALLSFNSSSHESSEGTAANR